jgi:hypothetical protein
MADLLEAADYQPYDIIGNFLTIIGFGTIEASKFRFPD